MSDLISRQAAIDKFVKLGDYYDGRDEVKRGIHQCIAATYDLPSAQPEQSSEIRDILNYLDTVLHPIISPEQWNVYSELHDMISMLPSAQPEQRWIPISERLPEEDACYLVTTSGTNNDIIDIAYYTEGIWHKASRIKAWMPLPERYHDPL